MNSRHLRTALVLLATTVLGSAVAQADILPPLNALTATAWQSVGAVNREGADGGATCTGTLIAADLVLTAAHCVRGAAGRNAPIYFVLGGIGAANPLAYRSAKIDINPAYFAASGVKQFRVDQAVIHLETPVPTHEARPIAIQPFDQSSTGQFAILAVHRAQPIGLNGRFDCLRIAAPNSAEFYLDCHVVSGNSGAPVLHYENGMSYVVGVITASLSTGSRHQALVAPLDQWVVDQMTQPHEKDQP